VADRTNGFENVFEAFGIQFWSTNLINYIAEFDILRNNRMNFLSADDWRQKLKLNFYL